MDGGRAAPPDATANFSPWPIVAAAPAEISKLPQPSNQTHLIPSDFAQFLAQFLG